MGEPCGCLSAAAAVLTSCECEAAGFCQRHGCNKTDHFHKLCRTRPDYFALYEEGRGPGCGKREAHKPKAIGLGDVVAWILSRVGIKPWPGCGCNARKVWLNRLPVWGWWRAT